MNFYFNLERKSKENREVETKYDEREKITIKTKTEFLFVE